MPTPPPTFEALIDALLAVLADGTARTEAEIADALRHDGLDLGHDGARLVGDVLAEVEPPVAMPISAGRHLHLPTVLDGRVLTRRLGVEEVRHGHLRLDADLVALEMLLEHDSHRTLSDGAPIEVALRENGDAVIVGVADTLTQLGAKVGDLVAVEVVRTGLALRLVDGDPSGPSGPSGPRTTDDPTTLEALSTLLRAPRLAGPQRIDAVVWEACHDDPQFLRRPSAPLGELLLAAGLTVAGDVVAPAGFDIDAWHAEQEVERIGASYDLDEDEAFAVHTLAQSFAELGDVIDVAAIATASGMAHSAHSPDAPEPPEEDDDARSLIALLGEPAVAEALVSETVGHGDAGAARLAHLVTILERGVPRDARANLRWIGAVAAERLGDILGAEMLLGEALDLDPDCWLALTALAQVASDRGDAERGLSLLRRADAPRHDELVVLLETFRPVERADVGRNDPCPCGSGRKFKVCHRGRHDRPLEERAAWLYRKAALLALHGAHRPLTVEVAAILAGDDADDDAVWDELERPLAADLVLSEGGVFETFVTVRGVLLPEDERRLAETWRGRRRSLHEVVATTPGSRVVLRDVRDGVEITVSEATMSGRLPVGATVCARPLPVGEQWRAFGGIVVVGTDDVEALLALLDEHASPEEIADLLGPRVGA